MLKKLRVNCYSVKEKIKVKKLKHKTVEMFYNNFNKNKDKVINNVIR